MTSFNGPDAVNVYAMTVLASGLRMYATTKMIPNRAYTPKAMMAAAERHLGRKFKARDYEGAAAALREAAQTLAANLPEGSSITRD